MSEKHCTRINT